MQIEITVKVNGQVVGEHVQHVDGTLDQMEERIDAMSREVACAALQAGVDALAPPRPLFQNRAENCDIRDTDLAREHFRDAVRILDWYHLSEHLWTAARVLYADPSAAKRWVSKGQDVLGESSGIGLLRYLQRSRRARATEGPAAQALDALIGYVAPRRNITDYVEYRQKGYVIGSGMMEATCKQLVGVRLKGSGRQWSEAGAVAMTALIAQRLNASWDAFWASRPLHRAA